MPRNTERPLNADEQRFIRHYVRERDIEKAQSKARLKSGQGMQLYKRKEVRADIDRRIREIEHEQAVLDAKDIDRNIETVEDLLGPELCKMIKLDAEKFGASKLNAVKLGYIVTGKIRAGNTEVLNPGVGATTSASIYESIYTRHQVATAPAVPATPVVSGKQPAPTLPPVPPSPAKAKAGIRIY